MFHNEFNNVVYRFTASSSLMIQLARNELHKSTCIHR